MADGRLGNQFWKNRSKHGRDKLFTDPSALWESACEYFEWCDENPLETIEFNGKDAVECIVPKLRAFTKVGLCVYLDCAVNTFDSLSENKDFLIIYTRICQIIYSQKFDGAAAGCLNASIIARDLGLSEKSETTNTVQIDMKELREIAEMFNK